VYVTHDQEEALTLSDRIAVFHQGKVSQVGPPKALYERPVNRFVADFIGISNLLDGTVTRLDAATGRMAVETALGELAVLYDERFSPGEPCVVSVRPENASIDAGPRADHNRLQGRVSFAAYLGNTLRYDVDMGKGIVFKVDMRDPWHHVQHELGTAVSVAFNPASTVGVRPS
jgi:ABC-type Fe3+/spermidine/putrescine transport system ATPase subunit